MVEPQAAGVEAGAGGAGTEPDRSYLRVLLVLLASAAFFGDGYDNEAFALLLKSIKGAFHVGVGTLGVAHGVVVTGQFVALLAAGQADRVGRRALLLATILGYTVATGLTAGAWDLWSFVAFQFVAQVCIGAEFGVAVAVVVEEFPAARRGRALGILLTIGPLGSVLAAVLLAAHLQDSALGWRAFYLIGILPLVLVALARRRLRETRRFEAERARAPRDRPRRPVALTQPWAPATRRYLVGAGAVSLLWAVPVSSATTWWAYYAEHERGYSSTLVGLYVLAASTVGTLGYYACGRAMDRWGRRPTATVYLVMALVFGVGLFNTASRLASLGLLLGAVFFGLGVGPALSAFATELFPTHVRTQCSAWVRNGFANAGAVVGPAVVGVLGGRGGSIGDVGGAVSVLSVLLVPAAVVLWTVLPESRGRSLESLAGATGGGGRRG